MVQKLLNNSSLWFVFRFLSGGWNCFVNPTLTFASCRYPYDLQFRVFEKNRRFIWFFFVKIRAPFFQRKVYWGKFLLPAFIICLSICLNLLLCEFVNLSIYFFFKFTWQIYVLKKHTRFYTTYVMYRSVYTRSYEWSNVFLFRRISTLSKFMWRFQFIFICHR
jgi:hypothetical protein